MSEKRYLLLLRLAAVAAAIVMWAYSVNFSADGFNFKAEDQKTAGVLLAVCITVIELVWNREALKKDAPLTIVVFGAIAYAYGIVTNVVGLSIYRGHVSFFEDPFAWLIPMVAGLMIEVLPEFFLVWGLLGHSLKGDFLGNLISGDGKVKTVPKRPTTVGTSSYRFPPGTLDD